MSKEYVCEKCGSLELFIKEKGNQTGLYCSDCGKWIKWLPKNEIELAKRFIEDNKKVEVKEIVVDKSNDIVLETLCKAVSDHLFNNPNRYSPYVKVEITGTNIEITETIKAIPIKRWN